MDSWSFLHHGHRGCHSDTSLHCAYCTRAQDAFQERSEASRCQCDIRSSDVWRGKPLPLQEDRFLTQQNKERKKAKASLQQVIPTSFSEKLFTHYSQLVCLPSHPTPWCCSPSRMGEAFKNTAIVGKKAAVQQLPSVLHCLTKKVQCHMTAQGHSRNQEERNLFACLVVPAP